MDGKRLKITLAEYKLSYEQFAIELNTYCKREVLSEATAKNIISNWVGGRRNIAPTMQFAIERFFQEKYQAH